MMDTNRSSTAADPNSIFRDLPIDYSLPQKMPDTAHELHDDDFRYEVLCVGTGLTECAASTLLTIKGRNILHIDDNDFFGRNNASLTINQLAEKFKVEMPDALKNCKSGMWCLDTMPKVIMPEGMDYKLCDKMEMDQYFTLRPMAGFVHHNGKLKTLPVSFSAATSSGLISLWSVLKFRSFIIKVQNYKENDPKSHFFKESETAIEVLKNNGFSSPDQLSWACFAFALHNNEEALYKPAKETIINIQKYIISVFKLANFTKDSYSPFMYIDYGSGGFCEGVARKAAVYGSTYRLMCPLKEILYDDNGHVRGAVIHDGMINHKDFTIECKAIVADPEMMVEKCDKVGEMVRAIFITKQPVPETNGKSCQIVVPPQPKLGKMHATYLCMLSSNNKVCEEGYYIIVISTQKDFTSDVTHMRDLSYGIKLLGSIQIVEKFVTTSDILYPKPGYAEKGVFITKGCDPSTHFQHQIKNAYEIATRVQHFFKVHNKEVKPAPKDA